MQQQAAQEVSSYEQLRVSISSQIIFFFFQCSREAVAQQRSSSSTVYRLAQKALSFSYVFSGTFARIYLYSYQFSLSQYEFKKKKKRMKKTYTPRYICLFPYWSGTEVKCSVHEAQTTHKLPSLNCISKSRQHALRAYCPSIIL